MKQYEADMIEAARARAVSRFGIALWLFFTPVLVTVLCLVFSAGYHAPVHSQPPVFSCASQRADDAVLGDGGAIAPLCGETPYTDAPETDGG